MHNRRLIRVKVFKILFAYRASGNSSVESAEKELLHSFEVTRDLYYFLLNICPMLTKVAKAKLDAAKNKFHPTEEEANPNYRFVNNRFIKALEEDAQFCKICKKKGLEWSEYDVFVKKFYANMVSSDYYAEYMADPEDSLKCDLNFIRRMFEEEFEDNEALMAILEDMSSWWVDDVEYVVNVINRGVEGFISSSAISHPDLFIKEDDREYALRLLEASLINYDEYFKMVTENLANWDSDRLVATDAALIVMGLAEAVTFSSIPVKVSINEYVELAKHFGTPNSRQFVNGLLDKLIQTKLASGEIVKSGRGLYEGEPA